MSRQMVLLMACIPLALLCLALRCSGFVAPKLGSGTIRPSSSKLYGSSTTEKKTNRGDQQQQKTSTPPMFFASVETAATTQQDTQVSNKVLNDRTLRRVLGSQELLMLPRQYSPGSAIFPQMNHVTSFTLTATPALADLKLAVDDALRAHPLLRARVEGDGEPEKRVDLLQMVRKGEPNPLTFVVDDDEMLLSADDIVSVVEVPGDNKDSLDASWQSSFQRNVDDGSWCNVHQGPLWKLELHRLGSADTASDKPCALVLCFNHAISDQSGANRLVDQLLRSIAELEANNMNKEFTPSKKQEMPMALEDSVMGLHQRWNDVTVKGVSFDTVKYVVGKAAEGFRSPVILPDSEKSQDNLLGSLTVISGKAAGGEDADSSKRSTTLQFRSISKDTTTALLQRCREQGVSISNALTAAVTLTASDFIDGGVKKTNKERNYKVLQSLDMRRFGAKLDKGETMACMAGSMDLMHGPIPDRSGEAIRNGPSKNGLDLFWGIAKEGQKQTVDFVKAGGPYQATRVFDFAMSISDLNNLVYVTGQSKDTKGRAYSAGMTNVGVYERQASFQRDGENERLLASTAHGRYQVEDVFLATAHTQSGCLYPVSGITVGGAIKLTFNPMSPLVSKETNNEFADAFVNLIETIAAGEVASDNGSAITSKLPNNLLVLATTVVGSAFVLSHAPAWVDFFRSVLEMKGNVEDPKDFWAALNFWIFFAAGHPILPPILKLSDVLHESPGPKIADLVPATFLAGNLAAIGAVTLSKEIRNAANIAVVAAFFTYVGAGLDGTAGMGDLNLALDDSYKGQVVKGCPAYSEVRQPSMDGFDLNKYQGKWYEQKFHDWTQFKEVYDTTLSIKLTEDGKGWVDDFAVKGPAPEAAKISWDKSPVANGAHYFLFGRVDTKDPPGVLRESGFGVEFPNYIVDVQKDPVTGEYTEAIQFQCLERGGVRVFEGINFMSRSPTMTDDQMAAMHARAQKAGMYPYGADPDQMHTVARKLDETPIDNNWQAMWRAIGVDKLLELLTESIEDGGR